MMRRLAWIYPVLMVTMLLLPSSVFGIGLLPKGADAEQSYYVRLTPADPSMIALLEEHAITDVKLQGESLVARLTLDQMTQLYAAVEALQTEQVLSVTFESVPYQMYELGLQPQEITIPDAVQAAGLQVHTTTPLIAVIVEDSIATDLQTALDRYVADVTSIHRSTVLLRYTSAHATPEELRGFLQELYQTPGIEGAILIGDLPYARWEHPWGEVSALPYFYENLDLTFLDQDGDGLYDYLDWNGNEPVEIWTAWIRPPAVNPVSELLGYLDKTHGYYSGGSPIATGGLLTLTHDWWWIQDEIPQAMAQLYGADVTVMGACENCPVTLTDYLAQYTSRSYGIQSLWVHSNDALHQFDADPTGPDNLTAPALKSVPYGAQLSLIWGGHALDFTSGLGEYFATRYLMAAHNGLAALGVTRDIGTPEQETLIAALSSATNLGDAMIPYLNRITAPSYVAARWPGTEHTFTWDIALVGDPFLFFDTTAPQGEIVTPSSGSVLTADTVAIVTTAADDYGVTQVKFAAWYNGTWHYLGTDQDDSDGYGFTWNVSAIPNQSGIRISAQFFDLTGNLTGATAENLTLERASATVTATPTPTSTPIPTTTPTPVVTIISTPTNTPLRTATSTPISTPTPPVTGEDVVIYADALADGWRSWSWNATFDTNQSAVVQSGTKAMAVQYNAPWGGLYLHSPVPLHFTPDDEFHFWIKGSRANQSVWLWLVSPDESKSVPQQVPLYADRWNEVTIPLRNLGDFTAVQGVIWQDSTGNLSPTYYLDAVVFRSAGASITPTPTVTDGEALVVFDDGLTKGWENWSWGSRIDFAAQGEVYDGTNALAVEITSAWGGLYLGRQAPLDLSNYSALRFWIYGSGKAIDVKVVPLDATQRNQVRIIPPVGSWHEVVIPLHAFGDFSQSGGLIWQDGTGVTPSHFSLDAITFTEQIHAAHDSATLPFEIIVNDADAPTLTAEQEKIFLPFVSK